MKNLTTPKFLNQKIQNRLSQIRNWMKQKKIHAIIIPTTDPHNTEYPPINWRLREYLSGFTGSAGTLVITTKEAGLWTDFRYFIQADKELEGSSIQIFKMGQTNVPDVQCWLKNQLSEKQVIAFDPQMFSIRTFKSWQQSFLKSSIKIQPVPNLCDQLWDQRPSLKDHLIKDFPIRFCGESRQNKISKIKEQIKKHHASYHLISSLYDIAWIFNLRGADTPTTPIFTAYALFSDNITTLYVSLKKINLTLRKKLQKDQIELKPYEQIFKDLAELKKNDRILLSPASTSQAIAEVIPHHCSIIDIDPLPSTTLKAVKNQCEISNLKETMIYDGIAMTKFFIWLEQQMNQKKLITEWDCVQALAKFRQQQPNNCGVSFESIVGYNENAALCHYSPCIEKPVTIKPKGILLIDSGGQYLGGTTDTTRTFSVGPVSKQFITDFTLVLKGHIQLSKAIFPKGTNGVQLDILARHAMWQKGIDFGHGTGHGVGFYLNVHEGPQGISPRGAITPLVEGMITTNEPGIYREGQYGIRTENILLTVFDKHTDFGDFLKFETLTLVPYDTKIIDKNLLTQDEIKWINQYHSNLFSKLIHFLNANEKKWLKEKTRPI